MFINSHFLCSLINSKNKIKNLLKYCFTNSKKSGSIFKDNINKNIHNEIVVNTLYQI